MSADIPTAPVDVPAVDQVVEATVTGPDATIRAELGGFGLGVSGVGKPDLTKLDTSAAKAYERGKMTPEEQLAADTATGPDDLVRVGFDYSKDPTYNAVLAGFGHEAAQAYERSKTEGVATSETTATGPDDTRRLLEAIKEENGIWTDSQGKPLNEAEVVRREQLVRKLNDSLKFVHNVAPLIAK